MEEAFVPLVPQPEKHLEPVYHYSWDGEAFILACDLVDRLHKEDYCPTPSCHGNDPLCPWYLTQKDGVWGWAKR